MRVNMSISQHTSIDMESLIDSRHTEKKQQVRDKVKVSRQLITSRRVITDPFPLGSFEMLQSNEIWEQVLSYLNDPSDITSAYFTCPLFQEYLEDHRRATLLAAAIQVIRNHDYLFFHQFRSRKEKANILNLREAFISDPVLKEVIDQQFFEHILLEPEWYLSETWYTDLPRRCYFETEEDIDQASDCLNGLHSGDSLIRSLHVNKRNAADPRLFHEKLYVFLDKYGPSIWALKFWGGKISEGNNYEVLWNVVSRTKNLKALCLVLDQDDDEAARENVRQKLAVYPFPKIASLKYFELLTSPLEKNRILVEEILWKNGNLKSVSFIHRGQIPEGVVNAMASLKLQCYESQSSTRWLTDGGGLDQLTHFRWPLKALRLKWSSEGDLSINSSDLFPALNLFPELVQLEIEFYITKGGQGVCVELPNLKTLHLKRLNEDSIGLYDLINLKYLEKLVFGRLFGDCFIKEQVDEVVKFKGFVHKLQESNVWAVFLWLKEIIVKEPKVRYLKCGKLVKKV